MNKLVLLIENHSRVIYQNEAIIIEAMAAKEGIYGLFSPKKLNPNLIVVGILAVILAIAVTYLVSIFVYSGKHNKLTLTKDVIIETNIPPVKSDSSR